MFRKAGFLCLALCCAVAALAAGPTRVRGVVTDASTGESLPYVSVVFLGSNIGTITGLDGDFSIENYRDYNVLSFQMLGYQTVNIPVEAGKTTENLRVALPLDTYGLQSAVVRPKRNAPYRRRGNPAVELVEKVIADKEANHIQRLDQYSCKDYEKQVLYLDDFRVDFDSSRCRMTATTDRCRSTT